MSDDGNKTNDLKYSLHALKRFLQLKMTELYFKPM